jgi:hypothetical protein
VRQINCQRDLSVVLSLMSTQASGEASSRGAESGTDGVIGAGSTAAVEQVRVAAEGSGSGSEAWMRVPPWPIREAANSQNSSIGGARSSYPPAPRRILGTPGLRDQTTEVRVTQ